MIFYFTGTGNSLWTAKELSIKLNENIKNIMDIDEQTFVSDNVIGIVCPVYMGDLPWIVKQQLLKLKINSKAYIFAVFTSNLGKSGKAADNTDKIFCTLGGRLYSFFNISMPGNCMISSKEQNEERLNNAPLVVENISNDLQNRTENYKSKGVKVNDKFVKKSFFYKTKSLLQLSQIKNFEITQDCNGCGICEKICPTNNITIKEKQAVHGDTCAACYACMHWCPKNATKVKLPILRNRFQYHHPKAKIGKNNITISDN